MSNIFFVFLKIKGKLNKTINPNKQSKDDFLLRSY